MFRGRNHLVTEKTSIYFVEQTFRRDTQDGFHQVRSGARLHHILDIPLLGVREKFTFGRAFGGRAAE